MSAIEEGIYYEVVWRTRVHAANADDAAKQARAAMVDPGNTQAMLEVRQLRQGIPTTEPLRIIEVQDPDRSGE